MGHVIATGRGFPIEAGAGGGAGGGLFPPCWAIFARRAGTLILKRFFEATLTSTTVVVVKLSHVAGLTRGGTAGAGCSSGAIFTQFIGRRVANCSDFTRFKSGWRSGINFRPEWYDDRGRSSFGHD